MASRTNFTLSKPTLGKQAYQIEKDTFIKDLEFQKKKVFLWEIFKFFKIYQVFFAQNRVFTDCTNKIQSLVKVYLANS